MLSFLGVGTKDFSTIIARTGESFAIVGDPYAEGGFLGWSLIRIGDLNGDSLDEIIVSAIHANTVYVIYGKRQFTQNIIYINELQPSDGFKIIGHPYEINFGVSMALLRKFRKDSHADLAITAQKASGGQNVIYILFGAMLYKNKGEIYINQIMNNSSACFKIITPVFSYAVFSLAGIGDINKDGFDDLAIGSVPYSRGSYTEQITYFIYGRPISVNSFNELQISQMSDMDGFIVTVGGFLVVGVDDVNGDGLPDVMISNYEQWQGKGNSYLMIYPHNITSPPPLLLSSQPTSDPSFSPSLLPSFSVQDPTNSPSIFEVTSQPSRYGTFPPHLQRTDKPTLAPRTVRPTRIPSVKSFTRYPIGKANPPSATPTRKPTPNPTKRPTRIPTTMMPSRMPKKPCIPSVYPTSVPSLTPTVSLSTAFQEIPIGKEGVYNIPIGKSNCIISGEGSFEIINSGGGKKIYTILPSKNTITITDFDKKYDQVSLIHFLSLYSISDLVYRTHPLQIFLSNEQKLVLPVLESSEFTENNFIFQRNYEDKKTVTKLHLDLSTVISLGVLFGCVGLFACATKLNSEDDKDIIKVLFEDRKQENVQLELYERLSSDFDSLLLGSWNSDGEDEHDEFSITNSSDSNAESGMFDDNWYLSALLKSFFSSEIDGERDDESLKASSSDDEFDDDCADIEGNYHNDDDDKWSGIVILSSNCSTDEVTTKSVVPLNTIY
jgi:hypothetical protein